MRGKQAAPYGQGIYNLMSLLVNREPPLNHTERNPTNRQSPPRILPDICHQVSSNEQGPIDYVGMTEVEMLVWVVDPNSGERFRQSARMDACVSLDAPQIKGIHMSRLYLLLQESFPSETLSLGLLEKLLGQLIQSQDNDMSHSALLSVRLDWPVLRKALVSGERGWRYYPVELSARRTPQGIRFFLSAQVLYSSTCPCSAALSRQLIQEQFQGDFSSVKSVSVDDVASWLGKESSMVATPHAQRSRAIFKLELIKGEEGVVEFIDLVEGALGTPVQTAVKRQDEQEFARLSGSQLMFCEDAARKLRKAFEGEEARIVDYWARVEHLESLHPHNVVSVVTKCLPDGLRP